MDAHIRLIQIAENCEESIFQKNEEYLKFKAQKNISTLDMEIFICRLYALDYPEEKIYWNMKKWVTRKPVTPFSTICYAPIPNLKNTN